MADSTEQDTPHDTSETPPPEAGGPKGSEERVVADLARERKKRQEIESRLKELEPLAVRAKELEDAQKTEAEKFAERLQAAEQTANKATSEAMRLRIALERAPDGATREQIRSAAKRLVGSTEDELAADADELFSTLALPATAAPPRRGAVDQGNRGDGKPLQLTREDLKSMSPQEIVKAKSEGRLNAVLGINR